jgi:hypothetical protein
MKSDQNPIVITDLGIESLSFVRSELAVAANDFDGLLAKRLLLLRFSIPFGFLPRDAMPRARDLRRGGICDGLSDASLANAVRGWLQTPLNQGKRLLILEEALGRRGDPANRQGAVYCGDRVYRVLGSAADVTEIHDALRCLSGYPGVGALVVIPSSADIGREIDTSALDTLANSAVAVLIRAWDDEAFAVVPVGSRLSLGDLDFVDSGDPSSPAYE